MKVSLITVTYNSKKTIAHCLSSVKEQDYSNIEHIIIDGASNDGTCEIVKELISDNMIFISEPDKGIYDAMNKGISLATGEIIGILNSDDFYYTQSIISKVVSAFISNKSLEVIYGDIIYVSQTNENRIVRKWISSSYYDNFFEDGNVPPHPSFFLKSTVYQKVGLFDLNYQFASDYDFMLRVLKRHKCKSLYINTIMVCMRLGGATNKSIANVLRGNREILNSWEKNGYKLSPFLFVKRFYKRLIQFFS